MIFLNNEYPSLVDIECCLKSSNLDKLPLLHIAVIRNVTVEPIESYLRYSAYLIGYNAKINFIDFDSFFYKTIEGKSKNINDNVDFIILFTPLFALNALLDIKISNLSISQIKSEQNSLAEMFEKVLDGIRKQTNAGILWQSFEEPLYPMMGIYDSQINSGQLAITAHLNNTLRDLLTKFGNAYIVNTNSSMARLGAQQFYDSRYWHISRSPYSRKALSELSKENFKFIRALKGKKKKCIVLDCDNTIWGGIIGEDGINGIQLGEDYPGNAFVELQQQLLSYFNQGIILALCSKNNLDDVWEVFDKHPSMVLTKKHIASWRINWFNKAKNIREIASELNINEDSIVFVDDSDFECNLIKEQLTEVEVIEFSKISPTNYRWVLAQSGFFDTPYITEEDRVRGEFYHAENQRRSEREKEIDLISYFKSLSMELKIDYADTLSYSRIAQQTQKTNQYNFTTRRYSEADIKTFAESENFDVLSLRLSDKYGDMGIVGSCILRYDDDISIIDTLLLSCRVLGRGIEEQFLSEIIYLAYSKSAKEIYGQYIPTKKNIQLEEFFEKNGFIRTDPIGNDSQGTWYKYVLKNVPVRELNFFSSISSPHNKRVST